MSEKTPSGASETGHYLQRLADGLDALAPAERTEVLTEIRGHIADATAEAGGDEAKALAGFGAPELLAARILQERGLIAESQGLQDAPGWSRWAAVALDGGRWLVLLWILVAMPFGLFGYSGPILMAIGWLYVAAVCALAVWWWGWKRRQRGYVTAGMNIMGLRRVRVGDTVRLVRATDLGEPKRGKGELASSVAWAFVILLIVASFGFGMLRSATQNSESNHQQEIQDAVRDAREAEDAIRSVYAAALAGTASPDQFSSDLADDATQLVARHASGSLSSYHIVDVQLPGYEPLPSDGSELADYEVAAIVQVTEMGQDGVSSATYEYSIIKHITDVQQSGSAGSFSWRWVIESAGRAE